MKPIASQTCPPPSPNTCTPAKGICAGLEVTETVENVALKALLAEQVITPYVSVPSEQVAVHLGGIRCYLTN